MAVIPLHIVDAFADQPFAGNPAAIVPNAAVLSDDEMVRISEEMGMEVGFVLPPEEREADLRLRFFVGSREDTLSGHVMLAAFTSLAERGIFRPTADGRLVHVETLAGVLEARLATTREGHTHVTCEMPNPRFGEPVPADEVAHALEVSTDTVRISGQGPQRVSCGFDHIVVPVSDRNVMRGVLRGRDRVKELLDERGAAGMTLFCPETTHPEATFHCRFLQPDERRCEDVASGTCMAALAAYAVEHGLVDCVEHVRLITEQGSSVGRPNLATIDVRVIGGAIHRVEVAGTGTVVMRGSFQFQRVAASAQA
jgi:trans-2,3-dihydro-3-hydroxyanthranilate isomerase